MDRNTPERMTPEAAQNVADEMTAWANAKMTGPQSSRIDRTMVLEWAERLRTAPSDADEDAYVIEQMGHLLAEIAVIVNGPEPANGRWSYHDLPAKVAALAQRVESLEIRLAQEYLLKDAAEARADALEKDAGRYRFLRDCTWDEDRAVHQFGYAELLSGEHLDAAIDRLTPAPSIMGAKEIPFELRAIGAAEVGALIRQHFAALSRPVAGGAGWTIRCGSEAGVVLVTAPDGGYVKTRNEPLYALATRTREGAQEDGNG